MPFLLLSGLLACGGTDPGVGSAPLASAPAGASLRLVAGVPRTTPDGVTVLADLRIGATGTSLRWTPLLVQGQSYGDGPPFGTVPDLHGVPVDGANCVGPDFPGVFQAHGVTWMLSHLECAPGALVLSELAQDTEGALRVLRSAPVPTPEVGPINLPCAGDVTPWGSLLSAEEYESDAALWTPGRGMRPPADLPEGARYYDDSKYAQWARGFGPGVRPSPYRNGWMLETEVTDEAGTTRTRRHGSMGRLSHELGVVMPDQRTVYLSDDTSYGILAMFVADQPGDLSAGTLYAATLTQSAGAGGDWELAVQWRSLGHATDEEVEQAIAEEPVFDDLFVHQPLPPGGECPEGLRAYRGPQAVDRCLAVRPGKERIASRLETRRVAALAGATAELQKAEGLALDPDARRLYLATTRLAQGMEAGLPPWSEADHLRLPPNPCGVVWSFALSAAPALDAAGAPIRSEWVATTGIPAVQGYQEGERCADRSISEPDNLAVIPLGAGRTGILLIAEDTDRSPNRLWAWQGGELLPVLEGPPAPPQGRVGEVSGLSWVPEALGSGWVTVAIQHPGGQPAMTGVLGPFPVNTGAAP